MARQAEFLPASAEIVEEFEFQRDEPKTERDKKVDDFADAMRELSDNGEVIVKRQTGNGKEPMEHVAVFEPDEYSYSQLVEHLRREYGGGLYRIYLRSGGKNRGNSLIRIAETLNKGVDTRPSIGGEVGSILHTVLERMDRMQQNQPQQTEKDFLEKMVIYKQLFSDSKSSSNPMAQVKETLELMNLLKEGNTIEHDSESGFSKLIESLAPVAAAVMTQPKAAPQNYPPKTNPQYILHPNMLRHFHLRGRLLFLRPRKQLYRQHPAQLLYLKHRYVDHLYGCSLLRLSINRLQRRL